MAAFMPGASPPLVTTPIRFNVDCPFNGDLFQAQLIAIAVIAIALLNLE
jgi:hypothetical protein